MECGEEMTNLLVLRLARTSVQIRNLVGNCVSVQYGS